METGLLIAEIILAVIFILTSISVCVWRWLIKRVDEDEELYEEVYDELKDKLSRPEFDVIINMSLASIAQCYKFGLMVVLFVFEELIKKLFSIKGGNNHEN